MKKFSIGISERSLTSMNTHELLGEKFHWAFEDDICWLTHPRWSLVGFGKTISEAEADLINRALDDYYTHFSNCPDDLLNHETIMMKIWISELRVIKHD